MTLRGKLLLAQAPLGIALAVLGVVAVATISSLGARARLILKDNYRSVLAAQRMKESIERIDSAAVFLLLGRKELADRQAEENRARFEFELEVQEGNITEPGEPEKTKRLRAAWSQYLVDFDKFKQRPTAEQYFSVLNPEFVAVKDVADDVLALNQDAMLRKSERADAAARRMDTIMVVAGIAALLLGMSLSIALTNRVLRPLGVLSQAVRRVGEGDLAARASIAGKDEIAGLAGEFNAMAARLEQYRSSSLGELLQAQQASQAAIDSLADPVIVFGIEGEVLNVNGAAESILGISLDRGEHPLARLDPAARGALETVRAHVLGGKGAYAPKGFEEAFRVRAPDGDRYLLPRATPVYQEGGGIMGATVVLQDVTRLRRFDELKNDLVATVAHEFRTPLTSLRMAIHLCIEQTIGPLTEKQADLLYASREDCERLQSIVDDLLNLSRIQAGRFEIHPQSVSALSLLKAAANVYRGSAEEKGVELESHFFDDPGTVMADPERIQLVFANLVANAIRHTPKGGAVDLKMRGEDSIVKFEVSDQGEGIPEEYQRRIFDRFFQVPSATHEGAGLGLAIAKEIVLAHHGEIGVQSEPGKGSTFWFTLPRTGA